MQPAPARQVPLGTFEQDRKLRPAEGMNRPDPSEPRDVVEPNFSERYFK